MPKGYNLNNKMANLSSKKNTLCVPNFRLCALAIALRSKNKVLFVRKNALLVHFLVLSPDILASIPRIITLRINKFYCLINLPVPVMVVSIIGLPL